MYTVKISGGCRESLYLKGTLSLFCSLIVCSPQKVSGLLSVEMTSPHSFQSYLAAISLETPSCCLLTNDGGRFQVYFLSHLHAHFTCFHSFPYFRCSLIFSQFSAHSLPHFWLKLETSQPYHFPAQKIFSG